MELVKRVSRLIVRLRMSREQLIEFDARALVQKLAREEAAIRSLRIGQLQGSENLDRLERRARNARVFRDVALHSLRRELGLAELPTAIEIGDWGVPPVGKPPRLPQIAELGI